MTQAQFELFRMRLGELLLEFGVQEMFSVIATVEPGPIKFSYGMRDPQNKQLQDVKDAVIKMLGEPYDTSTIEYYDMKKYKK